MKALIIEDNIKLGDVIKKGLIKNGFVVDLCNYGIDGEKMAFVNSYDVILLDLNLPDKDGLEILKFLRENKIESPIIITTARGEIKEKVKGLDLGADDYIAKPFDFSELLSRIHAVIRRFNKRGNPNIIINSLIINPKSRKVRLNNIDIVLSTKEFDILEYIALKNPNVVSTEEISEHIYDDQYDVFSSVLRVHIMNLRKKLNDVAGYNILITTRGKGYSLCIKQTQKLQ